MKTLIEMACEAVLHRQQHNLMSNPVQHRFSYDGYEENLERFAELVRADEREQPPKRTWVGLTDEEIEYGDTHSHGNTERMKKKTLAKSIEAKLKAKNSP